jgi:hypothetical protein
MNMQPTSEYLNAVASADDLALQRREMHAAYDATMGHIEQGSFHSPVDQDIASELAASIRNNGRGRWIAPATCNEAFVALRALVPVTRPDGRREIAGRAIAPGAERWIASRLESPEVDLSGPDGAWGRLPEPVKRELTYHASGMRMELTGNCTAACGFCSFANKGAITSKASFDSVKDVMQYFADKDAATYAWEYGGMDDMYGYDRMSSGGYGYLNRTAITDSLYWGTDPFDAKWKTNSGGERDFRDVAKAHERIFRNGNRFLFTSTAVPLGEEFRVLDFAKHSVDAHNYNSRHTLRLSKTDVNAARVDHMTRVLQGASPDTVAKLAVNDLLGAQSAARRGKVWGKDVAPDAIRAWDIWGPNCVDGAIIGVDGVRGLIMQGASVERPHGETNTPIERGADGEGNREYEIPVYLQKKDIDGQLPGPGYFRDAQTVNLRIAPDGTELARTKETHDTDPHRALLRLVGAFSDCKRAVANGKATEETARAAFTQHLASSVATVRTHVATGADNPSMTQYLHLLAQEGYISEA